MQTQKNHLLMRKMHEGMAVSITIDDLRAFIAVAQSGSFVPAAEELGVTQSALSRRLKKLEEAVGARLLDRTTRRLEVSRVGETFLPEALRVVEEFEQSILDLGNLVQARTGTTAIATNMTIAETVLSEIISRFREKAPNVRVRIRESSSPMARDRVLTQEAEIAIAQFGEGHGDLNFEPLVKDVFVLVTHANHPLAGKQGLTWADLEHHNFIRIRAGSGTTTLLERRLGEKIQHLSGDLEVGHFNAMLALVERNLGVSAIPTLVQLKRRDLGTVTTPISDPVISRSIGLITHRGKSLTPAATLLRDTCREVLSSVVPGLLPPLETTT
jgi:DNA-binding transcriptional LysR family regulator